MDRVSRKQKVGSKAQSRKNVTVTAPVALSRRRSSGVADIRQNGNCARISHEEYFADVVSASAGFHLTSYPIQPGVATIFPWLATIAQRYESYRFTDLRFSYRTEAATTEKGTVLLAVDYDAQDAAPTSKQQALSYKDAIRGAPWDSFDLRCDMRDVNKFSQRYTRAGAVSGSDIKTFDVGNLFVCLQGVAIGTVGELYVKYDVELYTPQIGESVSGSYTTVGAGQGKNTWFASAGPDIITGTLPFVKTSDNTLTFTQAYEGILYCVLQGTVMNNDVSWLGTSTRSIVEQLVSAAATEVICVGRIRAGVGQTFIPGIATAATLTGVQIYIASGSYNVLG